MANLSAFYETRNLFIQYTGFIKPLSFEQWKAVPQDQKSAVLFVQFFSRITYAWEKANAFDFIPGEDGVSTMLQYLEKNVPIILATPAKFSEPYIYRVAYNCLYCICHDLKSVKDRWENDTPNIVKYGNDELDLFDTVESNDGSAERCFEKKNFEKEFWSAIEDAGLETEKVVRYLLSGDKSDLKKLRKASKNYEKDPLRDIEVSLDQVESIIQDLRVRLASFYLNM